MPQRNNVKAAVLYIVFNDKGIFHAPDLPLLLIASAYLKSLFANQEIGNRSFRKKMHYHSAFSAISNPLLHFKSQSTAFYEVGMLYGEAAHFVPVPPYALHERTCRAAVALRLNCQFFAV